MDLIVTKIVVALLFLVIRFVFGILPIKIWKRLPIWEEQKDGIMTIDPKRREIVNNVLSYLQSFGGGVLFATCFLHMMPEVYHSARELVKFHILDSDFPHSQLIISIGFFLVYYVEDLSDWLISGGRVADPCDEDGGQQSPRHMQRGKEMSISLVSVVSKENNKVQPVPDSPTIMIKSPTPTSGKSINNPHLGANLPPPSAHPTELSENVLRLNKLNSAMNWSTLPESEASEIQEMEQLLERDVNTRRQILRCIIVVLALSLHAAFEGLAIGLQHSTSNIWYLFIAVSVHSATILFCMGLELLTANTNHNMIMIQMGIFSMPSPLGVMLGLALSLTTDMHTKAKSLTVVLLEGISAGTILYITFFEVLKREKERKTKRLIRGICIATGFTCMGLLELAKVNHES